jgi:hypothetical protein
MEMQVNLNVQLGIFIHNNSFLEILCLKMELESERKLKEMYQEEAEMQRAQNVVLIDQLEKVRQEKDLLKDRMIEETKIRTGIRMTK